MDKNRRANEAEYKAREDYWNEKMEMLKHSPYPHEQMNRLLHENFIMEKALYSMAGIRPLSRDASLQKSISLEVVEMQDKANKALREVEKIRSEKCHLPSPPAEKGGA